MTRPAVPFPGGKTTSRNIRKRRHRPLPNASSQCRRASWRPPYNRHAAGAVLHDRPVPAAPGGRVVPPAHAPFPAACRFFQATVPDQDSCRGVLRAAVAFLQTHEYSCRLVASCEAIKRNWSISASPIRLIRGDGQHAHRFLAETHRRLITCRGAAAPIPVLIRYGVSVPRFVTDITRFCCNAAPGNPAP